MADKPVNSAKGSRPNRDCGKNDFKKWCKKRNDIAAIPSNLLLVATLAWWKLSPYRMAAPRRSLEPYEVFTPRLIFSDLQA